jgi:GntR family transcriptional regulator, rspAB operon transcriptional repressor
MTGISDSTTADRIYVALSHSIIMGHCRGGDRLSPDELAKQYKTSVTPVREALQRLSRDGLVENRPHAGFFVNSVSLKQLRDMFALREILEVAAVELAAGRITQPEVQALERIHAGYTDDEEESRIRYILENRDLHHAIAVASGNQELAATLYQLHNRLVRFLVLVHSGREIMARHQRLIEALRSHDVDLARAVIIAEMRETRDITLDHVIQEQSAYWSTEAQARDRATASPAAV